MIAKSPLTDGDGWRLYAQHIGPREGEALERTRDRLLALLRNTSEVVSGTGTHAVQFGEHTPV